MKHLKYEILYNYNISCITQNLFALRYSTIGDKENLSKRFNVLHRLLNKSINCRVGKCLKRETLRIAYFANTCKQQLALILFAL